MMCVTRPHARRVGIFRSCALYQAVARHKCRAATRVQNDLEVSNGALVGIVDVDVILPEYVGVKHLATGCGFPPSSYDLSYVPVCLIDYGKGLHSWA